MNPWLYFYLTSDFIFCNWDNTIVNMKRETPANQTKTQFLQNRMHLHLKIHRINTVDQNYITILQQEMPECDNATSFNKPNLRSHISYVWLQNLTFYRRDRTKSRKQYTLHQELLLLAYDILSKECKTKETYKKRNSTNNKNYENNNFIGGSP